ncbi:hypothetical protein BS78_01G119400 [Paspalum vaginatum]|nr:hypothetical protein BS78_01G119400 [Paspalum vaginatum]
MRPPLSTLEALDRDDLACDAVARLDDSALGAVAEARGRRRRLPAQHLLQLPWRRAHCKVDVLP